MEIKEFLLLSYGPLRGNKRYLLEKFNLLWGQNEEGKTLTIDALTKLMLGQSSFNFADINRVLELPQGYILIEKKDGHQVKIAPENNLTQFSAITPSEFNNIFIIRNSDLSIASRGRNETEIDFYSAVTNRLTGLRTNELDRIKNKLRDLANITPTGRFRSISEEQLGKRLQEAVELLQRIRKLKQEIEQANFDKSEEKLLKLKDQKKALTIKLKEYDFASKREKYEKGLQALKKITEANKELQGLAVFNEEDKEVWVSQKWSIEKYLTEKQDFLKKLQNKEKEYQSINNQYNKQVNNFNILKQRKQKLDEEIRYDLRDFEENKKKLMQQQSKNKFFTLMLLGSVIFLVIALLGITFNSSALFSILGILSMIFLVISGVACFYFVKTRANNAVVFEKIKLDLIKFNLKVESVEDILATTQKIVDDYEKDFNLLQRLQRNKETLAAEIEELQEEKLPFINKEIYRKQEKINQIKINVPEKTIEGYSVKLEKKKKSQRIIDEQIAILKSHFDDVNGTLKQNISAWKAAVYSLEAYKNKGLNLKYNEREEREIVSKEQSISEIIEKQAAIMQSIGQKMATVQREVNEILRSSAGYLFCNTVRDLNQIENKLQKFISENEDNKENALQAIAIFEEIEFEEKKKIGQLFGKNSSVSTIFKEITNQHYQEVYFDQTVEKIEVIDNRGMKLSADKLSGGTYDQLYFAIRIALGEKLLQGEKGFFIMDDPFIKADPVRLVSQLTVLKRIVKKGWQVLYFSAKGEVKEVLAADINAKMINLIEINGK